MSLDNSNMNSVKLQPTWKQEPTLEDLQADQKEAESYHSTHVANLSKWKTDREGGKEIKVDPRKRKSKVRPKLVRKQQEWKYPALEEPFLSSSKLFEFLGRTAEDVEAAKQNQIIFEYQLNTLMNKTKLVNDIVRRDVEQGSVIVKAGWEFEEKKIKAKEKMPIYATPEQSYEYLMAMVQSGQINEAEAEAIIQSGEPVVISEKTVIVEKVVTTKNQPQWLVCNGENVMLDPGCNGDIKTALFLIHDYDTNYSELKKNEYKVEKYIDDNGEEIEEEFGHYKNIDNINLNADEGFEGNRDFENDDSRSFQLKDKARKKLRAFEYWGYWDIHGTGELVSIVATWVNNTLVRMEENPFSHNRIPYSMAHYMPVMDSPHGEPDAELLIDNQETVGKLLRASLDITSTHAVGQEFIDEQLLPSAVQKDNYYKGNTVFFRGGFDPQKSIHRRSVEPVPSTVFNMLQREEAEAESLTGTKSFSGGISGQALGASATGIRSALDATSKRELSILRRLSSMFVDLARMTIAMNQEFMEEEQVIRITNEEFATIRRDDLQGEFDLKINISTPEKDNETADKIMTLMQTNAANMPSEIANLHYAKIARLWNQVDLAEKMENIEPEGPSESQLQAEQMQMDNLRLENELLKKQIQEADSRISERYSRSRENEVDVRKKTAEASLKEAQASKLLSERDKIDYDVIRDHDGINESRHMEREISKHANRMEEKSFDALAKDYERDLIPGSQNNTEGTI
jgi:hypothetical protein